MEPADNEEEKDLNADDMHKVISFKLKSKKLTQHKIEEHWQKVLKGIALSDPEDIGDTDKQE